MSFFKRHSKSHPQQPSSGGTRTEWSESGAQWADRPLRCARCGATLGDKTPQFGFVRCDRCGAAFTIRNYQPE